MRYIQKITTIFTTLLFIATWTTSALAATKDCKPWEPDCTFKPPSKIVSQCALGEHEAAAGRCCWKGQAWDAQALICRGAPVCDAPGMEESGGGCIPSSPWMVFHQERCEEGYLGDCWRWARLAVPTVEEGGYALEGLPATALGPVLRPLCEQGIGLACAHLGAVLVAEEFFLRPDDMDKLNADNQTPAYAEGLALLTKTCEQGIADGCFALAESHLMDTEYSAPLTDLSEDEPASKLYKKSCDLGHSVACHRTFYANKFIEDDALPDHNEQAERACFGSPSAWCAFQDVYVFRMKHSIHRDTSTEAAAEARVYAQVKRMHDGCLRGDRLSCEWLGRTKAPSELHPFHVPPLALPRAARERVVKLAALEGEETRAFRCRMGMLGEEDTCDLQGYLLKKPTAEQTQRAWAFHDRRCNTRDAGWRCTASLAAWSTLQRTNILDLYAFTEGFGDTMLSRHLHSKGRGIYFNIFNYTMPPRFSTSELQSFTISGKSIKRKIHPNTKTLNDLAANLYKYCKRGSEPQMICHLALNHAMIKGDVSTYRSVRAKLKDITHRNEIFYYTFMTSADYWSLLDKTKTSCERYGEHCATYATLLEAGEDIQQRILDAPGEEPRRPKPGKIGDVRAALSRGCDRFDPRACNQLARWLNDPKRYEAAQARTDAAQAFRRACILGNDNACSVVDVTLLPPEQAAKLDASACLSLNPTYKACERYTQEADALPLSTREALCELGRCGPLLDGMEAPANAAQREAQGRALLASCAALRPSAEREAACDELEAALRAPKASEALINQTLNVCGEANRFAPGAHPPCVVAAALVDARKGDKALARRYEAALIKSCAEGHKGSCEAWSKRMIPAGDKPLKEDAFVALRDACTSREGGAPCERLWRLWQAQRVPQLSLEEGRQVGAQACFTSRNSAALCEEIAAQRLVGKQDADAYRYVATLRLAACKAGGEVSCGGLRQMRQSGQIDAEVLDMLLTSAWISCKSYEAKEPVCLLMRDLTR